MPVLQTPRARTSVGDSSVADRLVDVAERLYGRHGLEGVSLRQIGVAAGTANNNAVQYHFGDAAGLIRAILAKRMPQFDLARGRALARLRARGDLSTRSLIEALIRPKLDIMNEHGERALGRFLLALSSAPFGDEYWADVYKLMPSAAEIMTLLGEQNPGQPSWLLRERMRVAGLMVLTCVFNRPPAYASEALDDDFIENALDMVSAAVQAPIGNYARLFPNNLGAQPIASEA